MSAVAPGRGEMRMPPVSVCHQVSTIGQRPSPTTRWYHSQASGLIGSPTEPSRRRDSAAGSFHRLLARAHKGANGGGSGVENIDIMLVDDVPEARRVGEVRHAFEHQRRRAIGQRPIDDIAVARHPADIRRAPVDVALAVIEDGLMSQGRVHEITAGRVQHALGFAGRTRRIENEQGIFGVHFGVRAVGRNRLPLVFVIKIASRLHLHIGAGAGDDEDGFRRRFLQRRVHIRLERNAATAAQALVGGDNDVRLRILDPAGQRLGREAGEHHGMDGADAGAGQHGVGRLGDHGQIKRDAVALPRAVLLEHIGEAADLLVQFFISYVARERGVVALPDNGGLVLARRKMTVDAIHRNIRRAVVEPFDRNVMGVETRVLDLGERRDPLDTPRLFGPKGVRRVDRSGVKLAIARLVDRGVRFPSLRDRVKFVRHAFLHSGHVACARWPFLPYTCLAFEFFATSNLFCAEPPDLIKGRNTERTSHRPLAPQG